MISCIKEMYKITRIAIRNLFIIKKSYSLFSTIMQHEHIKTIDWKTDTYGDYPFIKSTFRSDRVWTAVKDVNETLQGKEVLVRARIHNIRAKGNSAFIVLRESFATLQAVAFKSQSIPKEMIKYMETIPCQSIVDITGKVVKPEKPIQSCSQQVELQILKLFVVNRAIARLPLQLLDASRKVTNNQFDNQEDQQPKVQEKKEELKEAKHEQTKPAQKKTEQTKAVQPKGEQTKPQQNKQQKGDVKAEQKQKKQQKKKEKQQKKKEKKQQRQKKHQQKQKQGQQKKQAIVKMKTRLDNRVIDLRTTAKQAIFRISSGVCQLFREYLTNNDFVEIHTPKLIAGSSQGGANVFALQYFGKKSCLAQSPQLYKQMCVMGDFQRVFEIGPVFRAQNSFTHRHMCQFVGLDIQMAIKQHYFEVLDLFGQLFPYIFNGLEKRFGAQLKAINEQFQFEPFKCKYPVVKITFEQGIALLKQHGVQWDPLADLDTPTQRKLGQIIKQKYDTDFYMLHRYPVSARPFYTTICDDDPRYTCSYDFFMRGQEILSGAQRIHDPEVLQKRAIQCKIDPSTIKDYIDCFRYGAFPHGGGGIGLERVVMLYCALKNIRNASLFPRDPKRITP